MTNSNRWILVVGFGSIGRRHYTNLKNLGWQDVRLARSGRPAPPGFETPRGVTEYRSLAAAFADSPWLTIVANPSAMHASTAELAVRNGSLVLVEKPLDSDLGRAISLSKLVGRQPVSCGMTYCFRYHPLYHKLKSIVDSGRLGRVFHAHFWQAQYLPDWHPWEDYHSSYAARRELGGGVITTLDHELDMMNWILGTPESVHASAASISGIDVDVEDTADMIFRYPDGMQANVHVSFGRRDYSRGAWIAGESGTAILDWSASTVQARCGSDIMDHFSLADDYDINDMYIGMLEDALSTFSRPDNEAAIPLQAGVDTLRLAAAALQSSETQSFVKIEDVVHE